MTKRSTQYRQENPRDQVIALLASVRGLINNTETGMYGYIPTRAQSKLITADEQIYDAIALLRTMPEGAWDNANPDS